MSNVSATITIDAEDINFTELKLELEKNGLLFDSLVDIGEDGEVESVTAELDKALQDLSVSASVYYSPATMYQRNGDPGDPEESGCEDVEIEKITIRGKKIDINGCVNEAVWARAEEKLWEAYGTDDRDYYDAQDDD